MVTFISKVQNENVILQAEKTADEEKHASCEKKALGIEATD